MTRFFGSGSYLMGMPSLGPFREWARVYKSVERRVKELGRRAPCFIDRRIPPLYIAAVFHPRSAVESVPRLAKRLPCQLHVAGVGSRCFSVRPYWRRVKQR